jgi:hypothetical protein
MDARRGTQRNRLGDESGKKKGKLVMDAVSEKQLQLFQIYWPG